jgi:hypothetical protein
MIILEFKDTKYFRMSILYDDRLKNLFNDWMENSNEKWKCY